MSEFKNSMSQKNLILPGPYVEQLLKQIDLQHLLEFCLSMNRFYTFLEGVTV